MLLSRRLLLGRLAAGVGIIAFPQAAWPSEPLSFDELYGRISPLGLEFSGKVTSLTDAEVRMRGFMAPPLKAEARFFVLTDRPMALCPFCSSDADWPDNIVVVYLDAAQTFEQANALIEVSGRLEVGSWTDPETGFVSRLRIVGASFGSV